MRINWFLYESRCPSFNMIILLSQILHLGDMSDGITIL